MKMNATQTIGKYQACIRTTNRTYLGMGWTPAEATRNAFDAAGVATDSPVFAYLKSSGATLLVEPCSVEWTQ